jgi:hypothetical protein
MLNRTATLLAFRNRLLGVTIATTGSATLAATGTGYSRTAGSFITDGFQPGLEITPAGFGANAAAVIVSRTATLLTTDSSHAVEAATAGRTLAALLPVGKLLENVPFIGGSGGAPIQGKPWMQEQFTAATNVRKTFSSNGGHADATGLYLVTYYGLAGKGPEGIMAVTDAILARFATGTTITDGTNAIQVSGDPGPWADAIIPQTDGFARCVVTIPWFAHTRITVAA